MMFSHYITRKSDFDHRFDWDICDVIVTSHGLTVPLEKRARAEYSSYLKVSVFTSAVDLFFYNSNFYLIEMVLIYSLILRDIKD